MFGNLNKWRKSSEKTSFLQNVKILFKEREDILNCFKSKLFPIETENTPYSIPRGSKVYASELSEIFINNIRISEKKHKQWNV